MGVTSPVFGTHWQPSMLEQLQSVAKATKPRMYVKTLMTPVFPPPRSQTTGAKQLQRCAYISASAADWLSPNSNRLAHSWVPSQPWMTPAAAISHLALLPYVQRVPMTKGMHQSGPQLMQQVPLTSTQPLAKLQRWCSCLTLGRHEEVLPQVPHVS